MELINVTATRTAKAATMAKMITTVSRNTSKGKCKSDAKDTPNVRHLFSMGCKTTRVQRSHQIRTAGAVFDNKPSTGTRVSRRALLSPSRGELP